MRATAAVLLALASAQSADVSWDRVAELFSSDSAVRDEALRAIAKSRDPSLLAGLNDVLYYHYVVREPRNAEKIVRAIEAITGEEMGKNARKSVAEWVGRHDEIEPREGYLAFKRSVFERYDPAFRGFLGPRFPLRIRPEEIEWGGVKKDGIPALDRPGFVEASKTAFFEDGERVFGVFLGGEAKAYPHRILDAHEMANDLVGGRPVSLSYCTLCGAGVLYDGEHPSRSGKEAFTFGSSGLLYRSNKLMYDRQTGSLWNQLTGEVVGGRLSESKIRLERLPIVVTTWGEWKREHPDSLVLDPSNTGFSREYRKSPYEAYFASPSTMFPVWLVSDRLDAKDVVFALIVNGRPKAYPIEVLKREGVTHDEVGGKGIVLLTNPRSGGVRAYESGGKRFALSGGALIESEASATYRIEEDALVSEAGARLRRIAGHNAFWFGWYAFYPTTEIYDGGAK
jgi:hypothetical protein